MTLYGGIYTNQIDKNTVSAKNQLKDNEYIKFVNSQNKGKRIMFLGNSITLHGVKHEIGWHNEWGMAASSRENDYVHILIRKIDEKISDSAYCICQGSEWEINYKNPQEIIFQYEEAKSFEADIIVMRLAENVSRKDFDDYLFTQSLDEFLSFLTHNNPKANIIITTPFWHHPSEEVLRKYAIKKNYPLVELCDLGELDEMKALGLFEHDGVANHPGDKGMKAIADRIFEKIKDEI